jgi:hypothetical protein
VGARHPISQTRDLATLQTRPGFIGAALHRGTRRPLVGLYLQWRTRADWDTARADLDHPTLLANRHGHRSHLVGGSLHSAIYAVHSLIAVEDAGDEQVITADANRAPVLIWVTPSSSSSVSEVLARNLRDTEAWIRHQPGFVAVSFHVGEDGTVFEYAQWNTPASFYAATARPKFRKHGDAVGRLASGAGDLCEVATVTALEGRVVEETEGCGS